MARTGPSAFQQVAAVVGAGLGGFVGKPYQRPDWEGQRASASKDLDAMMARNKGVRMNDPESPESRRMQDTWIAQGMGKKTGMTDADVQKMAAVDFKDIDDLRDPMMNYLLRTRALDQADTRLAHAAQESVAKGQRFDKSYGARVAGHNLKVTQEALKGNKEMRAGVTAYGKELERSGIHRQQFWTDESRDAAQKAAEANGGNVFKSRAQEQLFLATLRGSNASNLVQWLDGLADSPAGLQLDPEQLRLLRNVATLQNTIIYDSTGKAMSENENTRLAIAGGLNAWHGDIDGVLEHIGALERMRNEGAERMRQTFGAPTVEAYNDVEGGYRLAPVTDREVFRREYPDIVIPPVGGEQPAPTATGRQAQTQYDRPAVTPELEAEMRKQNVWRPEWDADGDETVPPEEENAPIAEPPKPQGPRGVKKKKPSALEGLGF
jgi:hypothetical protein